MLFIFFGLFHFLLDNTLTFFSFSGFKSKECIKEVDTKTKDQYPFKGKKPLYKESRMSMFCQFKNITIKKSDLCNGDDTQ